MKYAQVHFQFPPSGPRIVSGGIGASEVGATEPDEELFVAPGPNSTFHHDSLSDLAAQLNESVSTARPNRPDSRLQIGFVLTDMGIMVAWEVVPTDAEWEDEFASGEGLEHMEGRSNEELAEIFDLPRRDA